MRQVPGLVVLLALASPPPGRASVGYFQINGSLTALDGQVTTRDDSQRSTTVDFADIGFDRGLTAEARTGVVTGILRVGLAAAIFNHTAERSIAGFDFGGTSFSAEGRLESRLRWLEGEIGIAPIPLRRCRIEALAGVRWFDWRGTAKGLARSGGQTFAAEEHRTASGPVPHVGASFDLRPAERVVLRGMMRGLFLGVGDSEGHEIDIEATAGFRIRPQVEIGGGYRHLNLFISVDNEDTVLDHTYQAYSVYLRFGD